MARYNHCAVHRLFCLKCNVVTKEDNKWRHKHTSIVTSQVIEMFRYYKNLEKLNIVNLKRGQMCNVLLNLIWLFLYSSSYSLVHCLCPIFKSINFSSNSIYAFQNSLKYLNNLNLNKMPMGHIAYLSNDQSALWSYMQNIWSV